jgi:hypothetical protein
VSTNHAKHLLANASLLLLIPLTARAACQAIPIGDARWKAIDQQYATIERATFAKDPQLLFSVYAPDFEAHQFNGKVWKFSDSAAYSMAGLKVVKENISMSNTILSLSECSATTVVATVLQQWSRKQTSFGQDRLYQTATVQDETWENAKGVWLRKRVDNERPGAWLIDLKRVNPFKPLDPNAPEYDPHDTKSAAATK